jgi:molybdate transport system substrate-binding protein
MSGPRRRRVVAVALATTALVGAGCGSDDADGGQTGRTDGGQITVAAASDLRPAFEELGARFTAETGTEVTFSFGSSGQLAQQIANGAPFDLFASAARDFVDDVIDAGAGDRASARTYAFGRVVLWSPDRRYARLADLADPRVRKVAIANPAHAPYGRAGKQALERSGQHPTVEPKIVLGENISDTQRLVQSGNVEVGIIALSLAMASEGRWTLLPEDLHEPLEQVSVVTARDADAKARARAFSDHLASPGGRAVMRRYGLLLPGETLDPAAARAAGGTAG